MKNNPQSLKEKLLNRLDDLEREGIIAYCTDEEYQGIRNSFIKIIEEECDQMGEQNKYSTRYELEGKT